MNQFAFVDSRLSRPVRALIALITTACAMPAADPALACPPSLGRDERSWPGDLQGGVSIELFGIKRHGLTTWATLGISAYLTSGQMHNVHELEERANKFLFPRPVKVESKSAPHSTLGMHARHSRFSLSSLYHRTRCKSCKYLETTCRRQASTTGITLRQNFRDRSAFVPPKQYRAASDAKDCAS